MKRFALKQPIALQLACIGSRSTIKYGTNTTIKFGHKLYDKYFNVTNVEYYDMMLGTPFLRKLGITLDFSRPGVVQIGDKIIPIGKKSPDDKSPTEGQRPKASDSAPKSRPILANWSQEDESTRDLSSMSPYNRREWRSHLAKIVLGKRKEIPRIVGPNYKLRHLMASQHIVLTDNDIPRLHEEWMEKITDVISGIPLEPPPLH
jgi:hypothetical protein